MSDLRRKIIRLAHANPELRGDLVPLLVNDDLRIISAGMSHEAFVSVDRVVKAISAKYPGSPLVRNLGKIKQFLSKAGSYAWKAISKLFGTLWRFVVGGFTCDVLSEDRAMYRNDMMLAMVKSVKYPDLTSTVLKTLKEKNPTTKLMALFSGLEKKEYPEEVLDFVKRATLLAMITEEIDHYYC